MPASKAQQKATNKYIAKAYDRINLTVPKGKKDIIQAHAEANGQSVNAFINEAIDEKMKPRQQNARGPGTLCNRPNGAKWYSHPRNSQNSAGGRPGRRRDTPAVYCASG